MIVQFKGKGILVPVYLVASLFAGIVLLKLLKYVFATNFDPLIYLISAGLAVIGAGFWTRYGANEYYISAEGEKKYYDFDHRFMWLHMRLWVYIYWVLGGLTFFGASIDYLSKVLKN